MENPCDTSDVMYRNIPYTRKQHIVNMTHKVENSTGTKITITVDLTNKRQCVLRSAEGDVTTVVEGILPLPCLSGLFPENVGLRFELDDDKCLWSLNSRLSLIHDILPAFNSISLNDHLVAELETRFSCLLFSALLNSNDEGYNVFDVVVVLEVATVDTYDEEEVAQAMSIAASALRYSIQALPSKATVTQLPCSDDCYRGFIDRWLNLINSCPSGFFHLFFLFALYISFLLTLY